MNKKELFKKLLKHFASSTVYQLLDGRRRPSYKKILVLKEQEGIPFEAWRDIKSFITDNDTKQKKIMKE
jgi:hypothetical protein